MFEAVRIISRHIQPTPSSEVERLEKHLGIQLPLGYKEFVTRFGEGLYCGFFRIYPPNRILEEYAERREWWENSYSISPKDGSRHWFFEGSEDILSEAQLQQSIIIGDSIDGDNLIFYPPQPDKIFVLPRHSRKIFWVKSDFSDLHHWDFDSPALQIFESGENRVSLRYAISEFSLNPTLLLANVKQRWGDNAVLLAYETSDSWSWELMFYLLPIGGSIEAFKDEGVTHTATDENGITATYQGSGRRRMWIWISCEEEAVHEVEEFVAGLSDQGLIKIDHKY